VTRPIKIGDIVFVIWTDSSRIYGKVLHTPSDTGDMWYIEAMDYVNVEQGEWAIEGSIVAVNPGSADLEMIVKPKVEDDNDI